MSESAQKQGRNVLHGTLNSGSLEVGTFDVVSLIDVIEHVDNPVELIGLCKALLKPGGVVRLD